jgi:outer membrane receptor protein involved in Fe transport
MRNVVAAVVVNSSNTEQNLLFDRTKDPAPRVASGSNQWRSVRSAMLVLLAAIALLCMQVSAQVRFGSVLGTVADSSGAMISGAAVKLTNLGTNEVRTVQTASSGLYAFPNLNAGLYRVEVELAGFKRFIQDKVEVQVDVTTRVDATLQVGNVTETVVVTTEAPPLQSDNASLGTVISQQEVQSIPLSGRNINNMLTLVPGVVAQGGTYGNAASNQNYQGAARTNAIGFGNYSIGGGFGNQSSFYVDGVASNAPAGNLNTLIPSQDVVQEFRVVTNNVAAEYGNYAGGVINLTTKSGTNAFHGAIYEYLRNKVFNANDYFAPQLGLPRAPLVQNQYGGTLGGPIIKDKTFFFFGLEREAIRSANLVHTTVPTAAMLAGDFSAPGLPAIYDQSQPGSPQFQCNGVLNKICPDRLDPTAVALFKKLYPAQPLQSGAVPNNYSTYLKSGGLNNQYNARVDHHFSDKDNLFARYTYWQVESLPYDLWGTQTQGQGKTGLYTHEAVIGDTYAINPSTVLDLRLSYVRAFQHELPMTKNVDLSQFGPGWAGLASNMPAPANLPGMNFSDPGNYAAFSPSGASGVGASQLFWHQNLYSLSGNLTKIAGRHTVKFGGVVRRVQWIGDPENGYLDVSFNQQATSNTASAGGFSVASALLGVPASSSFTYIGGARAYFSAYGFFVDDTFQATKKLTVTAGLRWDQPGVYSEARNNDSVFLPKEASPLGSFLNPITGQTQQLMGNMALVDTPAWPSQREDNLHWKLFSPRLGLAYRLTDKTVLRAAYGISYPPTTLSQDGPGLSPINGAASGNTNFFNPSNPALNNIVATTANPFPDGISQPPRRNAPPSYFYGLGGFTPVPGSRVAYVQQWNAAVERQIGKDAALTVAYAGSRGTHLLLQGTATFSNIGLNQLPDQYFSMGAGALLTPVPNPFYGIITNPTSPLSQPTVYTGQLLRPFPQFGSISQLDPHLGKSNYRSLQVSFMKRFGAQGGILSVAYTWSQLMANTDSTSAFLDEGFIFGGGVQDNNHLEKEYSVSSYDIPHNLEIGYGIDLPFGRSKHFLSDAHGVLNAVVGGWRVNGITSIRSGVPFGAAQFFPGSALATLGGGGFIGLAMRPDYVAGCNASVSGSREYRAAHGWFNTACFAPVPVYDPNAALRFGNAPRNNSNIRMDYMDNWDFSIAKRIPITEKVNLTFTSEFFNGFNRPRFGPPGTFLGPTFGIVTTQVNPPRAIQFGLRVSF